MGCYKWGWIQLLLLDGVETAKEANGFKLCKGKYSRGQCCKACCSYPGCLLNSELLSCLLFLNKYFWKERWIRYKQIFQ